MELPTKMVNKLELLGKLRRKNGQAFQDHLSQLKRQPKTASSRMARKERAPKPKREERSSLTLVKSKRRLADRKSSSNSEVP